MLHQSADTEPPNKPSRRSIKAASGKSGQHKRRDEALQRQQAARQNFVDHARRLATSGAVSNAQLADQASSRADPFVESINKHIC